eukprot:CAMPEP_0198152282 /NCGR_PEP_ID=MMETSP1443-20131203/59166_1 /TAXON_ID=186043 /ORGANISM="Entomoneis sp., Strain CCMP2396" /LENGTH=531 /DNA_ID=CAMNT_0043818251 /DNA_START=260 /DNA_END=1855 /DNA_ORIENTATION=-
MSLPRRVALRGNCGAFLAATPNKQRIIDKEQTKIPKLCGYWAATGSTLKSWKGIQLQQRGYGTSLQQLGSSKRTIPAKSHLSLNDTSDDESITNTRSPLVMPDDLPSWNYLELKNECRRLGLKLKGTKQELAGKVTNFYNENVHSNKSTESTMHSTGIVAKNTIIKNALPVCDPDNTYIMRAKGLSKIGYGSAVGIQLFDEKLGDFSENDNKDHHEGFLFVGSDRSSFEADYRAILIGLHYAYCLGATRVILQIDNAIIVQQLEGRLPVAHLPLRKLYWKFKRMLEFDMQLQHFEVKLISRSNNGRANQLATMGLATGGSSLDGILNLNIVLDPIEKEEDNDEPCGEVSMEGDPKLSSRPTPAPSKADTDHTQSISINPEHTYLLQFDGGCRGNPLGVAGAGVVIYDQAQTKEIWCGYKYLNKPTEGDKNPKLVSNNQAEYMSFILVMEQALALGIRRVLVQGDSDLIVKQVNGIYAVRERKLKTLYVEAMKLKSQFDGFSIEHIFRAQNARADFLANHAMDFKSDFYGIE